AMAAMKRAASGEADEARGTVRLTASEFMGAAVLPPMLARFHDAHLGVAIELALSNRLRSVAPRGRHRGAHDAAATGGAGRAPHRASPDLALCASRLHRAARPADD